MPELNVVVQVAATLPCQLPEDVCHVKLLRMLILGIGPSLAHSVLINITLQNPELRFLIKAQVASPRPFFGRGGKSVESLLECHHIGHLIETEELLCYLKGNQDGTCRW